MKQRLITYLGLYALLALASLPLILGWVPPNRWFGFRLPGTLHDPALWYAVNALGGTLFAAATGVGALLNLVVFRLKPQRLLPQMPVINGLLILLSFWLVSLELVRRLPG